MKELLQAKLLEAEVMDQGGIKVYLRRYSSFSRLSSDNNSAALFVLDGMIVPYIDYLNPQDVPLLRCSRTKGVLGYTDPVV